MSEIKDSYSIVEKTIKELMGDGIKDLRLEEIDFPETDNLLSVTVSYLIPNINKPELSEKSLRYDSLTAFLEKPYERVYKKVIYDKKNQQILSIKNQMN